MQDKLLTAGFFYSLSSIYRGGGQEKLDLFEVTHWNSSFSNTNSSSHNNHSTLISSVTTKAVDRCHTSLEKINSLENKYDKEKFLVPLTFLDRWLKKAAINSVWS